MTWAGTTESSTWDTTTTNTNWNFAEGETQTGSTSFFNDDSVTFTDVATSKTVSFVNGGNITVGTATVESGEYIWQVTDSGQANISGSTLTIASGASLKIGSAGNNTGEHVGMNFEKISVAGTLIFNTTGENYWSSLELTDGGRLNMYDGNPYTLDSGKKNLTIGSVVVSGNATIDFEYDKRLAINDLSGSGTLTVTGQNNTYWGASPATIVIGSLENFTGTANFNKGNGGLTTLNFTGSTGGATLNIGDGLSATWSKEGVNTVKNLTLGENTSLEIKYGVGLNYETLTMKDGSVLSLRNGAGSSGALGSENSTLLVDNATTNGITIKGSLFGDNTNIKGKIEGNGKVKFTYLASDQANSYTVSAKIQDGSNGKISVDLSAGQSQIVTFSGDNTYSGGTVLNSGILKASHANALGTGAVTVSSGAKLQAATNITFSSKTQTLTLKVSDAQKNTGTELITSSNNGSVTISGEAKVLIDISGLTLSGTEDVALEIAVENALNVNDTSFFEVGSWTDSEWVENTSWFVSNYDSNSGTVTLSGAVPEPSMFGLLAGLGALALVGARRRRKTK